MSSTLISILNPFFSIFGQKWPFGQTKIKFPSIFGKKANIFWDEKIVQKEREFLTLNRFEPEQGGLTYSNLTFKTYPGFFMWHKAFYIDHIVSHYYESWFERVKMWKWHARGASKEAFSFQIFYPVFLFPFYARTNSYHPIRTCTFAFVHVRTCTTSYRTIHLGLQHPRWIS